MTQDWNRTIVSAMSPRRRPNDCAVLLKVWFEELEYPVWFVADPFDCERHGKELWIRAMAGEFGPVMIDETTSAPELLPAPMLLLAPPSQGR